MVTHVLSFRDAVLAGLKAAMPELRDVAGHGGQFTQDSLKHFAMASPACRVAILGVRREEVLSTGELSGPVSMVAYLIAEDEPPQDSWDVAMALAEKLAGIVQGSNFDYERAGAGEVHEIENLYSLAGERRGATLVAVAWRQPLRFGVNTYLADEAATDPLVAELADLGLLLVHEDAGEPIAVGAP